MEHVVKPRKKNQITARVIDRYATVRAQLADMPGFRLDQGTSRNKSEEIHSDYVKEHYKGLLNG